jgi:hypothetical protein
MKLITILLLAAAIAAAQDEKPFKGTISGLGDPEPAAYVPDPELGYAGPAIVAPPAAAPGVVVLFSAVPVAVDAPAIGGLGYLSVVRQPAVRRAAPVVRAAARRR